MNRALKILVADDASFMRGMLIRILKDEGREIVAEVETGIEAIEFFKKYHPDVVFMDIIMPARLGITAIEAVKKILEIDHAARIVMCSPRGQVSLMQEARDEGARDELLKPYTIQSVRETLQWAMQK